MLKYKGYTAVVNFYPEDNILVGDIINTKDTITFSADKIEDVEKRFHEAVDQYLEFCSENDVDPEKPFSGNIPLRITPQLHHDVSVASAITHESINSFIKKAIEHKLEEIEAD